MDINNLNIINEYEEYIKYVSYITIIKSRKLIKDNNNCLLIFNHKHYYYNDKELINKIDDIIINYLKKFMIDYNILNEYGIPLYIYLFTSDKLIDFLMKYGNYNINYLYDNNIIIKYCEKRYGKERFENIRNKLKSKCKDNYKMNDNIINNQYKLYFNTIEDIFDFFINNIIELNILFNNNNNNIIKDNDFLYDMIYDSTYNVLFNENNAYKYDYIRYNINQIMKSQEYDNQIIFNLINNIIHNDIKDKNIINNIIIIHNRLYKLYNYIINNKGLVFIGNLDCFLQIFLSILIKYNPSIKINFNEFQDTLITRFKNYSMKPMIFKQDYIKLKNSNNYIDKINEYNLLSDDFKDIFNNDYNDKFIKYLSINYDCKISNSVSDISPITHIYLNKKYNLITNINDYVEDNILIERIFNNSKYYFNYNLNNFEEFIMNNINNDNDIYYFITYAYMTGLHSIILYIDKKYKLIFLLDPYGLETNNNYQIYNFILNKINDIIISIKSKSNYKILYFKYKYNGLQTSEEKVIINNINNKSNMKGYCYYYCLLFIESYYLLKDILNKYIQNKNLDNNMIMFLLNYYLYYSINTIYNNEKDINITKFLNCYANRFPILVEYNNPMINFQNYNTTLEYLYDFNDSIMINGYNYIKNYQNTYKLYDKELLNKSINYHLSHFNIE